MEFSFKEATLEEFPRLLEIYASARSYMKSHGNPNQWGDIYPKKESIIEDIQKGISMVLIDASNHIYGVFALCKGKDPTYEVIEKGNWKSSSPYLTIHRIASSFEIRGFAQKVFAYVSSFGLNIRCDTHEDNLSMQKALTTFGFEYCGIIHIERGEERLAYEYVQPIKRNRL